MSNVRYGEGVTREVGCDVVNLGIKNLCVVTDKNVRQPIFAFVCVCTYIFVLCPLQHTLCTYTCTQCTHAHIHVQLASLPPLKAVLDSLHNMQVSFTVYDNVSIEPTNERLVQEYKYF